VSSYATLDAGNDSDSDLLRRAADSDGAAWDELVSRHEPLVLRTARTVGLQASDAADAAQLTWLRLFGHMREIREPEHLAGWLAVTARREAVRIARANKRYALCAEPDTEYLSRGRLAVTDSYPVEGQYGPVLAAALAQLPPRYEALIRILMSEDSPRYSDVAKRMGIPIGSIGPMRMRALHMLRQILAGAFGHLKMAEAAEVAA
jgi:RNA polymerase sigma factor (sigma-70 family)